MPVTLPLAAVGPPLDRGDRAFQNGRRRGSDPWFREIVTLSGASDDRRHVGRAAAEPLLRLDGVSRRFGAVVAAERVTLDLAAGELHALIGPNGAGKSTLVDLITGVLAPDSGRIELDGRDLTGLSVAGRARLGLARSFQIASLFEGMSARDNVAFAVQAHAGHSFRFWRPAARVARLNAPAERTLARVGLAGLADRPAGALSHGDQRRLELAIALAGEPRLLLLDEPMAGLGALESAAMVALLAGLKGACTVLLVEHDMDAVFALADRISVLDYGRLIATGVPAAIRAHPEVQSAYLGAAA